MRINKKIQAILLLILSLVSYQQARASHYAAVDLFVTYIGAGIDGCTGTTEYLYEVTFDQYKACETGNAGLDGSANISIRSASLSVNTNLLIPNPIIDTLDELCDSIKPFNSCRVPANQQLRGYVRHRFVGNVILAGPAPDWVFSWSSCCRNGAISNINCASIYVEAGLNNVIKYNNSTPRFREIPLPYLCTNQPAKYLNRPEDPNNDSLRTTAVVPLDGNATTFCGYNTTPFNYSLADPIECAASNPFRVDPFTGAATFTPLNAGFFVLAFRCDEYDRATGISTGYTRRDAQISILNCNAPPPIVDTSYTTGGSITNGTFIKNSLIVCPGSNLTYTANSNSDVSTSELYMDANEADFPGATFAVTGEGTTKVTGVFSWTPTQADLGEKTLTIVSKDSTCSGGGYSIVLKNYIIILIRVVRGLDAGKDLPICDLNPTPRQLFVKGTEFINSVKWTDISGGPAKNLSKDDIINPLADPTVTTTYVVSTPDLVGNCKSRDTVSVFVDTSNTIDIFPQASPFVMCRPDYLQLDVSLTGKGPLNNLPCGPSQQAIGVLDSANIYGSPVYGIGFSYDSLGAGTPIFYNDIRSTKYQYLISKNEIREYGMRSSTLRTIAFETTKATDPTFQYYNFSISLKCTNKTALNRTTGFETGMIPVYISPNPISFPNGVHKFSLDTPYDWDTTKNLIVEICYNSNPNIVPCAATAPQAPVLKYMPTVYTSALQLKADAASTSVCGVTTNTNIKEFLARPVFTFGFNDAPYLPFNIIWNPGQYLSDSTSKQPLSYVSKSTRYTVNTFGNSGCLIRDTIDIVVPVHDFYVLPKDTSICFGETAPLSVKNGTYFEWFEFENGQFKSAHESASCDRCASPVLKPKKSTFYKIKVGDELFCYDTIDAYIEVKPLPVVNILTKDTVIKYGQSVQLMVNGARIYNWTPVSSLNNPNISYPIARPTESTQYVVGGIATNGCVSFDTVRVGIDYRDNLFIPTAFSPNGDGKNDLFKVTNMTFQRYAEFRVFNRWGQEVYNGNKGWDGTWRGVAQESGTYTYLIRVAYPDGEVETYKGDVTLVR
ncbi:hypothetical protein CAP35_11820 [Chitinophagaceae bacterium IBVUCB1]|nr:hypothetical protein CAP35_11820 [Chitinophagaceae bacterium IBVUCB1]